MNINKNLFKFKLKKIYLIYSILLLFIMGFSLFEVYKYNSLFSTFKSEFDCHNYSEANNLLLTSQNTNPLKQFFIQKDLKDYFSSKISELSKSIDENTLSEKDILLELKEIDRYNILSHDDLISLSCKFDSLKTSNSEYNKGLAYYNSEDYSNSVTCLKKVSFLDLNYDLALKYISESNAKIKENVFAYCDELASRDYYSKAINILSDNESLSREDPDVKNKIQELKEKQTDYYNKNSSIAEASSGALTSTITPNNINTLNITSNTSYLVNVNIGSQKTYIYKGKNDNWKLIRTCPCSTGIDGEETPCGSFSIQEKGSWFFSEKFKQGGKYWTQITGDILFHSVPFARDKKTIVDYTLNKPASHGCIRLSVDDAKWIYTNVPRGSKIIIK